MGSITSVLSTTILAFLILLALSITYAMLTGRINMRRLLVGKERRAAGGLSPSRLQLLLVTVGIAVYLISEVLRDPTRFPEFPTGLLLLLAASEGLYLARKANKLILRSRD